MSHILSRYNFQKTDLYNLCALMVEVKLLRELADGSYKSTLESPPIWKRKGPLEKKWGSKVIKDFLWDGVDEKGSMRFIPGYLTQDQYSAFREKMQKVESEFRSNSLNPEKDGVQNVAFFYALQPWTFSVIESYLSKDS